MWCIASSSTFKDMPQGEGQANSTHSMTTRACMLCVQLTATKNSNTSSALPNYEAKASGKTAGENAART